MNKNLKDVGDALLAWINSLDYPNKTRVDDIFELQDGVVLTGIMSKMLVKSFSCLNNFLFSHPKYFNLSHMIFDHNNTWAYVHKNINYLYDSLEKYYVNVFFLFSLISYGENLKI